MRLSAGEHLGPYEIVAPLGAGGMGEVYRAHDPRLGREVAIKVLPAVFAADRERLRRFEQEARAAAALNHTSIVTIHSVEETNGIRFITMELVEGQPLSDLIPPGGLPLDRLLEVAIPLADALAAAHAKGITHRDLKPANIMVGADRRVTVLDFGLAKLREASPAAGGATALPTADMTGEGRIVGTVAYMSPEQAEGKPIDHRSDLFSLGVILYEMATGRRPFTGETSVSIISSILKDTPPSITDLKATLPRELGRIIRRALAKDTERRYQTPKDMRNELEDLKREIESAPVAPGIAPQPAERVASIAVLPFTDMSAAKDQDWFCDGIAEEILNALTPLEGLRVAARTSAFSFKGKGTDLRAIGEKLNVTTVLEGSVRRAGDRVRITVQLSDVHNGFQLWSERFDRELKDIFDVQDEIARAIAERLRVTLAGGKDDRLVERATTNVEAYQLYLKGRQLALRRGTSLPPALDLFRKAVELDSGYALAWAGIADAFTGMAIAGSVPGSESKPHAIAAATRSIALDPTSAAGHAALACATLLHENNRAVAKQEFERALELSPSDVVSRCWYALLYLEWARGEYEQGIAEARRALDIDPLSAYASFSLGGCLYTAGRLDEAIDTLRRGVQLDPESFVVRWLLGVALGTAERFEEAVSTLEAALGRSRRASSALASLATVFAHWGKPSEAIALHRELMDRAPRAFVPLTYLVLSAEAAGQHEEAMAFARRAWDDREPTFLLHARHFPEYRTLRADPRFAAILREMNEP
jgi:serine/threonine protein kinase/tetratricopeptide (TPR) repeat protein